jgi:hypothetical protein
VSGFSWKPRRRSPAPSDVNTTDFAELLPDVGFLVVEDFIEAQLPQQSNLLVRTGCADDPKAFLFRELADEPIVFQLL